MKDDFFFIFFFSFAISNPLDEYPMNEYAMKRVKMFNVWDAMIYTMQQIFEYWKPNKSITNESLVMTKKMFLKHVEILLLKEVNNKWELEKGFFWVLKIKSNLIKSYSQNAKTQNFRKHSRWSWHIGLERKSTYSKFDKFIFDVKT